jgi:large subunit ribosomal protein L29
VKASEFLELGPAERRAREAEMREQMFRIRFQLSMGQVEGLKKYRALRKDLARLLGARRREELGGAN